MSYARQMLDTYPRDFNLDAALYVPHKSASERRS
jgi:hypothetical protein